MGLPCEAFTRALSSKEPVPGGGGASAYVGALGVALGSMVGNLTLGKAKYADVQDEIVALIEKSEHLRLRMQDLVAADAEMFGPLAKAYGLPKTTEAEKKTKEDTLEIALKAACDVPLAIMAACCEAIGLHERYVQIGSKLAISDVGAGVVFCKAALIGASLNVFINTKMMRERAQAAEINSAAEKMIDEYSKKADEIFLVVRENF
jgi:formiminotetrahydrofolate cyclodeaminase